MAANGWPYAERRQLGAAGSDVAGTPGLMWEVKACKRIELAAWVDQAEAAAAAHPVRPKYTAVVVKRRGRAAVGEWYAILPVASYCELLTEAGWAQ